MSDLSRSSALTRRRARRLSETARATLLRAPLAEDRTAGMRTMVIGRDPIRILLFGSGPLIGYGVTTRHDAVDGPLAHLLAESTGRGVIIENRVRLALAVKDAVSSLGGAGTTTFSAAVWAPRFTEELEYTDLERARVAVREMLRQFRATSLVPLVICQLPEPQGHDWRTVLRRPRIVRLNRILLEEAAATPCVTSVATGTYKSADPTSTTASWHRTLAAQLAPAVVNALTASAPSLQMSAHRDGTKQPA